MRGSLRDPQLAYGNSVEGNSEEVPGERLDNKHEAANLQRGNSRDFCSCG
jgi:hypothetical protein